jgi:murein L,D-transpeptidase YafK
MEQATAEYGPSVRKRLRPAADRLKIAWPPKDITLLAFKSERILEVWAKNDDGVQKMLAHYPILAASGELGPKRREGDRQVPEGVYSLTFLNPNSRYHLSIKVDYPNASDIHNSVLDRSQMGGDIFVHGSDVSIGCIAIGNEAIEQVFCLAAWAKKREIIISPVDFRKGRTLQTAEAWVDAMYRKVSQQLMKFR